MSWPAWLDDRRFVVALVAAWALAYLPHLGTRDVRHEEGRRATPAREMLDSGRFVCPTLYGDPYLNKPPLYPWLVAAVGAVLGEVTPLAARLPSALAALGCALVALRFAPAHLDRRTRALAALFVLASTALLDKGTLGEIDATLTLLVAAALKVWWDGYGPDRQTTRSWLGVGVLLGLAGLLKGPAGPVLFYLGLGPFLVWQRQFDRFRSAAHLLALGLMVVPGLGWAWLLIDRGVIGRSELTTVWAHQLGLGKFLGLAASPTDEPGFLLNHYATFPLHLVVMFFPAVAWAWLPLRRRWAERHAIPEGVRRFLVCAACGPALALWVYPESRPRHVLPILFPVAVLGAMAVLGSCRPRSGRTQFWRRSGFVWSEVPLLAGVAAVVLAAVSYPRQLPAAWIGLGAGGLWTWYALRRTRASSAADGPVVTGVPLAGAVLAAWAAANAVLFPGLAPRASTRLALAPLAGRLDDEVVYTTRRFPVHGEGYFNLQFHLARRLKGVGVEELKGLAPCTAVVTTDERAGLEAEGLLVEEVGWVAIPNGPPAVWVVRVR